MSRYFYLDVLMKFEEQPEQLLPVFFKGLIHQNLNQIFGEIGGYTDVEILKFDKVNLRAILQVPADFYVKLRAALTLTEKYQGVYCYFKVLAASPLLINLIDSLWDII